MVEAKEKALKAEGLEQTACLSLYRLIKVLRYGEIRLQGEIQAYLAGEPVDPLRVELVKIHVAKYQAKKALKAVHLELIKDRVIHSPKRELAFA